jgi:thiol-disulfide isomerase/thioredoxin
MLRRCPSRSLRVSLPFSSSLLSDIFSVSFSVSPLSLSLLPDWLERYPNVFVNFYTPWCEWCQDLEAAWEITSQKALEDSLPVNLIKVNCEKNLKLCERYKILAFPTIRFFRGGVAVYPDYSGHRTIDDFFDYLHQTLDTHPKRTRRPQELDHVGCRIQGHLLLNRSLSFLSLSHSLSLSAHHS